MKKVVSLITVFLAMLVLFSGCGAAPLAASFDEAKVKDGAKASITALDEKKFEEFSALVSESIKSSLSAEVMKKAIDQVMPNAGKFKEYTSQTVAGTKDKDGNDCAVAVMTAKYENQKVTYTITFDKEMKIVGFYLK